VPRLPRALEMLQPLLDRLLAKEPEERYQTGNDVAAAIAEFERRTPAVVLRATAAGVDDDALPSMRPYSDTPAPTPMPAFAVDLPERGERADRHERHERHERN